MSRISVHRALNDHWHLLGGLDHGVTCKGLSPHREDRAMAHSPVQSSVFARKFRAFLRWMRNNGIEYTDGLALELGGSKSVADTGVRALYAMQADELIATIPKQACLTVKTTGAAQLIEEEELGGGLGLVVAVMYERSLQGRSNWFGYLQSLPNEQKLPFLWSPEEIDYLLEGTELHKVIKEDRVLMEEDWKESIAPLSLRHPNYFPANWFTLSHYLGAKTLVASRAFEVDEYHGYGMVPLADLFNHKTAAEAVHIVNDSDSDSDADSDSLIAPKVLRSSNHVKEEKGDRSDSHSRTEESSYMSPSSSEGKSNVLEMILVKDVAAGAEIFNTYGTLSNAALLHRYGFTEADNPFDIVNIDLALVSDLCLESFSSRHIRRCTALWRKVGCTPCNSQDSEYFEISAVGKPQEDLLMLLFLVHLSDQAFDKFSGLKSIIDQGIECTARALGWAGTPKQGPAAHSRKRGRQTKQVEREDQKVDLGIWLLTASVARTMHKVLEKRDSLYPTSSLEDDLAQLSTITHIEQPQQFHALVLRSSERSILRKCAAIISHRLATLGSITSRCE